MRCPSKATLISAGQRLAQKISEEVLANGLTGNPDGCSLRSSPRGKPKRAQPLVIRVCRTRPDTWRVHALEAPLTAGLYAAAEGQDPPRRVDDRAQENSTVDPPQAPPGAQAIEPIAGGADAGPQRPAGPHRFAPLTWKKGERYRSNRDAAHAR